MHAMLDTLSMFVDSWGYHYTISNGGPIPYIKILIKKNVQQGILTKGKIDEFTIDELNFDEKQEIYLTTCTDF